MKPLFPATLQATSQSRKIAADFLFYCRSQGLGNKAVMDMIRCPCGANPTYSETLDTLERTWLALMCGWRHPNEGRPESHFR